MTTPTSYDDLFDALMGASSPTPTAPVALPVPTASVSDIVDASRALTGTANVPDMVRPFLPHQAAAYNYITDSFARFGGAVLGHDMGLGKTQVFLAQAADVIRAGGKVLLVGPTVAKGGYLSDLRAAFPHLTIAHLYGRKPGRIPTTADIYYLSDDPITLRAWLCSGADNKKNPIVSAWTASMGLLIRDEIHRDKGTGGKPTLRAKVMLAVSAAIRNNGGRVIGATGTLLTNRPVEAFLPLQIVGGEELVKAVTPGANRAASFLWRYCAPEQSTFGTSFNGCDQSRMGELHELLRANAYCRIEKSDLGASLPHGGWLVRPLAIAGLGRLQRLEAEFLSLVLEEDGPEAMWRKARAETITRMTAMWEEAGIAKAEATVEYVADLVEQGRQVVLFYYHDKVFKALRDGLAARKIDCAVINGSVTGDHRLREVSDFQSGKAQVLLGQIRAAGMAVTLTAAADAVFAQVPWSAGDLKQAADRILRADDLSRARALRGEGVTWHVLQTCHGDGRPSIDDAMWTVLESKAQVCDAVNAGRPITMPDEAVMKAALQAWVAART